MSAPDHPMQAIVTAALATLDEAIELAVDTIARETRAYALRTGTTCTFVGQSDDGLEAHRASLFAEMAMARATFLAQAVDYLAAQGARDAITLDVLCELRTRRRAAGVK